MKFPVMSRGGQGWICGAIAAATYGMNPLFALPLYRDGLSADTVLLYRYGLALIVLGVMMKLQRQSFALRRSELLPLAVGGLLFAGSSLFLFLSYHYMAAGIASTILFVYPVMVAVIMSLFFHEKVTWITAGSITLALAGIGLLYRGEDGAALSATGVVFVFLSALSYAIYLVGVNFSSLKEMPSLKLTFYALLFGSSLFLLRLALGDGWQAVPSGGAWLNLTGIALVATVISLWCTALAIRRIGSTPTAILGALEPATAVFFGVTVFHEALTVRMIFGILMIIASVTLIIVGKQLIAWSARRRKRGATL